MAPQIKISLNPPNNDEYYTSNDTISGSISIDIGKPASIKQINVIFKGFIETVTKIDPVTMRNQAALMAPMQDTKTIHTVVNIRQRVFPPENVLSAIEGDLKPFKVKEGVHKYAFKLPKIPRKPSCLSNHSRGLTTFLDRDHVRLPPSFNNEWKDMLKFDNLDLFFYSFGKVLYMVQVKIELGKPKSWYRPFEKILSESQVVEFIPQARDLTFKIDDKPSRGTQVSSSTNDVLAGAGKNVVPLTSNHNGRIDRRTMGTNSPRVDVISQMPDVRVYRSTYRIELPDERTVMWLEARSSTLRRTYRKEPLFAANSGKFDAVYLVMMGNKELIEKLRVVPTKIQLNLLENVTYLSQGVANQNVSSLRLAKNKVDPDLRMTLLKHSRGRFVQFSSSDPNECRWECELKLKDHPQLKKLRFNEEDYRHRGNRLYSFKSCSIRRLFSFQLVVDWDIVGVRRQSEIIVDPMQIFVNTNENLESLPRYIPPPSYSEI
ncbi:ART10 (YLR392C) [Zygosaccharomyces parabailii]|nr:ART10 (YLR392C) [Zygosaccharomyces parabailii]CDH17186.1 probable Arrestin-related trafficking adapter 10 [Zygosaccharomyces bailii ISA1307]